MNTSSTLAATHLTKVYPGGAGTTALAGVSITVEPRETVAIMGPSGSGKTSLLHVLAGIIPPTSGQVWWRGRELSELSDGARSGLRRSDFSFVFQSGQLLPELPADENAALPLMLGGTSRAEAVQLARNWLSYLGLAGMEDRRPGELSGGQAQRVAIARALVGSPGVIFADEPTGALDQHTGAEVLDLLTRVSVATGASLVVVTHDPAVARTCGRTVHMRDGRIVGEHRRGDDATVAETAQAAHSAHPTHPAHPAHPASSEQPAHVARSGRTEHTGRAAS